MKPEASVRQRAESLAAAGRVPEALALLEALAATGDPEAMFTLGVWRATGQAAPRDLASARELFERAAAGGLANAATIHTNFLASGTGGPADWPTALTLLRERATKDPHARQQLLLIGDMAIGPVGDPLAVPQGEALSASPDVRLFRDFFSASECTYLAAAAGPLLRPSVVVDKESGRQIENPIRTSDGAMFTWALENPAVHALNRRIAAASGTDVGQGEPLQVLRYRPGQQYRTHVDAIPGVDNQRAMTVLVYLNDDYEGGETRFVATGLDIKGRRGDAILFRNIDDAGRPDRRAAHAGLPVGHGIKLIASRWIRQQPFVAPEPRRPQ